MKKFLQTLKNTFIAGAIFLLPLLVVVVVLTKIVQALTGFSAKIAGVFGLKSFVGISGGTIVSTVLLILFCLLCGVFAKYSFFKVLNQWMDKKLQKHLPGYTLYRNMAMDKLQNKEEILPYENAAWIQKDNMWQPGFVMESATDNQYVVFIPSAGNVKEGAIYRIEKNKVQVLPQADIKAFQSGISKLGVGLSMFKNNTVDKLEDAEP